MKFEIPFVEEIYKSQTKLNFEIAWKENLKKSRNQLFIYIPILALGVLMVSDNENNGYFLIFMGLLGITIYLNYLINYYQQKKKYFLLIDKEAKQELIINFINIWEFDEDFFRIKNYKYEAKFNWIAFKGFRNIQNNIFLDLNSGYVSSYILSQEEIGEENYKNVINLLERKFNNKSIIN